jgi:hypothetical protein
MPFQHFDLLKKQDLHLVQVYLVHQILQIQMEPDIGLVKEVKLLRRLLISPEKGFPCIVSREIARTR